MVEKLCYRIKNSLLGTGALRSMEYSGEKTRQAKIPDDELVLIARTCSHEGKYFLGLPPPDVTAETCHIDFDLVRRLLESYENSTFIAMVVS